MSVFDGALNVITFGGHGRLKNAQQEYEYAYGTYSEVFGKAQKLKNEIDQGITCIGKTTQDAFLTLNNAHKILRNVKSHPHRHVQCVKFDTKITPIETSKSELLLSSYSSAFSVAGGLGVGSVAALGSWSLVSLLGVASTGTSIATLSGVAATNATLAWFGGGALAAGGAGMAGGMTVLGGLFAIPVIAYAVWNTHSQVGRVEEQTKVVSEATKECRIAVTTLEKDAALVAGQRIHLDLIYSNLSHRFEEINSILFPKGIITRLWRFIRGSCRGEYFLESEMHILRSLGKEVEAFSSHFSSGVIDLPSAR